MEMKLIKPFNKRILVIDDNQDILETYKDILSPTSESIDQLRSLAGKSGEPQRESFDLVLASQGQEGFECVKKALEEDKPFAAAFIDMRIPPGWDGLETAQKIRELDNRIYIIIVTGYADFVVDEVREAVKHNLLFVRKPFTEEEIYQLARNFCQSWQRDYELEEYRNKLEKMVADRTVKLEREITVRKQAGVELIKAKEEAEKSNSVKTLFLANMSHEIRTPLNAVLGFTDLLETSTRHLISEEEKGFFKTIKNSGNRLMQTVHKILDISQLESGTYPLDMKQHDLSQLVKDSVDECRLLAAEKNLKLEFKSPLDSAFINADQNGISQAVNNIIDNAIKYSEQGKITVLLKQGSENYIVIIQDTGIGISKKYTDNLYEVFSQESEGYTKKYQGIGLGMAIAKRHLDLNKVGIDMKSVKGAGTTFTLTFKAVKKWVAEIPVDIEEIKEESTSDLIEKPQVLLVEDGPNSQMLTKFFLKGKYDTCFADSVAGAKRQLKNNSIDLILLDFSLVGGEDGLDLVRWMRKTKQWKNLPTIALTAHAFATDRENCLAAGCHDYLTKPIKRAVLLKKIAEFV